MILLKQKKIETVLLDFIVIVLLALVFIPQFKLFSFYNYFCLLVMILWVILAFSQNYTFFLGSNKYFTVSISLFILLILFAAFMDNSLIANRYVSLSMIPLFYWIYSYNDKYRGLKQNIRISLISFVFIFYSSFQTILELRLNSYAARSIKTSVEGSEELFIKGVSGYGLIYSVVILVFVLIPLILERRRLGLNVVWISFFMVLLLMFIYLIILSNFFTALIVALFGMMAMLLIYKSRIMLFLFAPMLLFYFILQKEINIAVIDAISGFAQSEGRTYVRLQEIKANIEKGSETTSVDSRSEVMYKSFDLFVEYPVLGYVGQGKEKFNLNRIGQHSYILDTYALYGLFLGTFVLWIMWFPFHSRIKKKYEYRLRVFSWVTGSAFILLIIFNNLTPSMGFTAFFVFPTVFEYINQRANG